MLRDDDLLAAVEADWRAAPLDDRRKAILAYAEKLTVTPWEVGRADVDELRAVGLSERDVLDVCQVVAYYAYANRIADGLGVEVEPWFDDR